MKTNSNNIIAKPGQAVPAPLQIVLTYDHPSMADAARNLLGGFLAKWAADVDVHRDEWSFAELEHPQCRSEALELGRQCDVFIVALSGITDLPDSFMEWLGDWLQSRARVETALILVTSGGARLSHLPKCASLADRARAHDLSFFTTAVTLPGTVFPEALHPKTLLARLGAINSELLPDFSGINE